MDVFSIVIVVFSFTAAGICFLALKLPNNKTIQRLAAPLAGFWTRG